MSLVFERVAVVCGVARPAGHAAFRAISFSPTQAELAAEAAVASPRASDDGRPKSGRGCVKAALKLLDDLCMMATGECCQQQSGAVRQARAGI